MWAFVLKKRPQNDTIAHHFGNYYGSDDYFMYGIIYCIATAVHKQAHVTEKDCGILHGTKTETEWSRFVRKIITIKRKISLLRFQRLEKWIQKDLCNNILALTLLTEGK